MDDRRERGRGLPKLTAGLLCVAMILLAAAATGAGAAASEKRGCGKAEAGSGGADPMVGGPRADRLVGAAGHDGIEAGRGDDCLSGGAGRDFLGGGPGDDRLLGGPGDDRFMPGEGTDRVRAGGGADLIFARDGVAETVGCGRGRDRISADDLDVLRGCEIVTLAAPQVLWYRLYMHLNAYGWSPINHDGWGYCTQSNAQANSCKGRSEEGNVPYQAGQQIVMDWQPSAYGGGQVTAVKAPESDSLIMGRTDPRWVWMSITNAEVGNWIDPNHGVIRTGTGGDPGTPGGPLKADLSWHSFPQFFNARRDGYSLDLNGWVKFIFIS